MKLSELKKLAEAATQATDYCGDNADIMESYFDAANPQTILALLTLIEKQHYALQLAYSFIDEGLGLMPVDAALSTYEEMK